MNRIDSRPLWPLALALGLAGCAAGPAPRPALVVPVAAVTETRHAGADDLLTAGLGAAGLQGATAPPFADAANPTPEEQRRRAVWSNWRGIADLSAGGGYGSVYGSLAPVPGREFHAESRLPGARAPHRLLLQLPDSFDAGKRCVVVTASSGSRGIYGAIALAGSWGLAHGCAVAYTDKGAGTDYQAGEGAGPIATRHAHSGDNPEADWGRHVQQAAQYALQVLAIARPQDPAYTFDNTRVIAVGVSNGGGAVLRAAELPGDWLDGVVAVSSNIQAGAGGRALYDYSTEAALYMPCALNADAYDTVAMARGGGKRSPAGDARCQSLHATGGVTGADGPTQAEQARAFLHAAGWTDPAIAAGALSVAFDLWRSVDVTYASSYARTGPGAMPCGYAFHALDAQGAPRAPTAAERAAWPGDASGIPPGAGVAITDALASGPDPAWPGLQCLRQLWVGEGELPARVQAGVAATRSALPRTGLPVLLIHGLDDGLIPEAFSSAAYARWARAAGRDVRYWQVENAQHFDAFLGLPVLGASYLPMLPYAYRGLDAMWAHLEQGAPLPGDARIATKQRSLGPNGLVPLEASHLGSLP